MISIATKSPFKKDAATKIGANLQKIRTAITVTNHVKGIALIAVHLLITIKKKIITNGKNANIVSKLKIISLLIINISNF